MKVGLIGLGRMGGAMWRRLREQGFDVVGWDHDAQTTQAHAVRGLSVAANACAVAERSDVVISIITEDHGVRKLFTGPDGFLTGDIAGRLFIEMSTLQPATGRAMAEAVAQRGAAFIDSPVLGTVPSVRDGKLLAMVGGAVADVARGRIVLDKLTRRIEHMGPVGAGYAMKLAVNLGLGAYIQALSESLALGLKQGLHLEQMLDVLREAPTATNWLAAKIPILKGEKADVTLDLRTLRKDLMSAVATGAASGVPMPVSSSTLASLSAAVAGGAGDGDLAELARYVREHMLQNYEQG
jgi:3-hydroxyisobutyrate dehydrogenase